MVDDLVEEGLEEIEEEEDLVEEVEMVVHVLVDDQEMEEVDSEDDRETELQVDLAEMDELLHRETELRDLERKEVLGQKEERE